MNKLLLAIGVTLVALLTALFAVPPLVDWNNFKGILEEEASRALGREVRVAGKVDLRILPAPYVQFERVSVADARGITGAPFVEAKSFRLWLSVSPLLRGAIEARRVELEGAELRIRVGEDGGGNWQTLKVDPSLATWLPADVAFQSIELVNSRITVEGPRRNRIASLDGLTGELSTPALAGPYKFVGSVGEDGARKPLRLSLSEIDQKGQARLRAQIGGAATGPGAGTLAIDGTLEDVAKAVRFNGALTFTGAKPADGEGGGYEMKTVIAADAFGATSSDVTIAFEQGGRPQMLSGTASARWRSTPELDVVLASRWLDLDRISASAADAGPLAALDKLAALFGGASKSPARIRLALAIDQATLAGDVVSGIGLDLVLADGRRLLDSVRMSLPGGTQAHASGELVAGGGVSGFNGRLILEGSSRTRFLAWVGKGRPPLLATAARDDAFRLDGQLTTSPDLVAVTDARLGLDGATVGLSMSARHGTGTPFLNVALSGRRLDLAGIAPGSLAPEAIVAWLAARGLGVTAPATTRIKVRLEEASDGTTIWRNVDLDLALDGGTLDLARLEADLAEDAHIEASGRLTGLGAGVAGALSGVVAAADGKGSDRLRRLFIAAFGHSLLPDRLPGAGALRLAWRASLAAPGADALSRVDVDGTVGADAVRLEIASRGSAAAWRGQPFTVKGSLAAVDAARTLSDIAGVAAPSGARGSVTQGAAGRFDLIAEGRPDRGLRTHAGLVIAGASATLDGMTRVDADDRIGIEGALALTADKAGTLAQPFYPRLAERMAAVPFAGRLRIRREAAGLHLEGEDLALGAVRLAASLDLAKPAADGPFDLTGRIEASQVLLPALVSLITAPPEAGGNLVDSGPWIERPFALGVLTGMTVSLDVAARRLEAAEGLATGPARFTARLADGRVALEKLEAAVLGGTLAGDVALTAHAAGAAASGRLTLTGGAVQKIADGRSGKGGLAGSLTIEGVALSPRALATTLKGEGSASLTGVTLDGLATDGIAIAAATILAARGEPPAAADTLAAALDAGALVISDRTLALRIADGALRVAAMPIDGPGGRAVNRITVDLAELAIESDWRLEPAPLNDGAGVLAGRALPPVQLVYVGRLAAVGALPRRIAAEPLARELTVLKMERDVRELERIRRADEERANAERERQRLEVEERLRAAEEARRLSQQPAATPLPLSGEPGRPIAAPTTVTQPPPGSAPTGALPAPTMQTPVVPAAGDQPASGEQPAPAAGPLPPGAAPQPASRRPPARPPWQPFGNNR